MGYEKFLGMGYEKFPRMGHTKFLEMGCEKYPALAKTLPLYGVHPRNLIGELMENLSRDILEKISTGFSRELILGISADSWEFPLIPGNFCNCYMGMTYLIKKSFEMSKKEINFKN